MVTTRVGIPFPDDYLRLLAAAGWSQFVDSMFVARALEGSLCCVLAEDEGNLVGFGRVVGDGASYFCLQDVVVDPGYHRQGIGTRIMEDLLEYLRGHAPPQAFVGLFAARGNARFYDRFGFQVRGADEPGMSLTL